MVERSQRRAASSVWWSALLTIVLGCASNPADTGSVHRLYELSGFAARVASTAEAIDFAVSAQSNASDGNRPRRAADLIHRAYAPQQLESDLLREFEARYDPALAPAALAWVESELGRRITREALDSVTPGGAPRVTRFASTLRGEPPSQSRIESARQFDAATGSAEFHVRLTVATAFAVANALQAAMPESERSDPAAIRADIEARLTTIRPTLVSMATLAFLYTVRELSDAEVERYLAFASSDVGGWYHRSLAGAYLVAVEAAAGRINAAPGATAERSPRKRS